MSMATHLSADERAWLENTARSNAEQRLERLYGGRTADFDRDMAAWEGARARLVSDLAHAPPAGGCGCTPGLGGGGGDVDVQLTTRNQYGSFVRLAAPNMLDGEIHWNPFHYEFLSGDPGAMRARGVLFDYLHERDHDDRCLDGSTSCGGATDSAETATTLDIDRVLRASGLPTRGGDYGASSFRGAEQAAGIPGPGAAATLQQPNGTPATVRSGTTSELVHGR